MLQQYNPVPPATCVIRVFVVFVCGFMVLPDFAVHHGVGSKNTDRGVSIRGISTRQPACQGNPVHSRRASGGLCGLVPSVVSVPGEKRRGGALWMMKMSDACSRAVQERGFVKEISVKRWKIVYIGRRRSVRRCS